MRVTRALYMFVQTPSCFLHRGDWVCDHSQSISIGSKHNSPLLVSYAIPPTQKEREKVWRVVHIWRVPIIIWSVEFYIVCTMHWHK